LTRTEGNLIIYILGARCRTWGHL